MTAAVIGAGPAGLMAAEVLARAGVQVTVYEAMPSPARKFLMAGKSGLNLTFTGDSNKLLDGYGDRAKFLRPALEAFDHVALRNWAEELGIATFVGSTGRVFPVAMKASPLLRAWLGRLQELGVEFRRNWRWSGWSGSGLKFETPEGVRIVDPAVTILACGGASWPRLGSDGGWSEWVPAAPFQPSNAKVLVDWSGHMSPYFGTALKNVQWQAGKLLSRGEAVLTRTGLEGGGVYPLTPALRDGAVLKVDLLPDMGLARVAEILKNRPHSVTLTRWLKRGLRLDSVKAALTMEVTGGVPSQTGADLAGLIKTLPIQTAGLGRIEDAISSAGGVPFEALDDRYMLRARPGVFCAGEMLDWEAPTGGWLLSACFATGAWAGLGANRFLGKKTARNF